MVFRLEHGYAEAIHLPTLFCGAQQAPGCGPCRNRMLHRSTKGHLLSERSSKVPNPRQICQDRGRTASSSSCLALFTSCHSISQIASPLNLCRVTSLTLSFPSLHSLSKLPDQQQWNRHPLDRTMYRPRQKLQPKSRLTTTRIAYSARL